MSTTSNTLDTISKWLDDQGIDFAWGYDGEIRVENLYNPDWHLTIALQQGTVVEVRLVDDHTDVDDCQLDSAHPEFFDQLLKQLDRLGGDGLGFDLVIDAVDATIASLESECEEWRWTARDILKNSTILQEKLDKLRQLMG
jgi:hypothetical protein